MAKKKDKTIHKCFECKFCVPTDGPYSRSIDGKIILGTCKFEKYKVVLNYIACFNFKPKN